MNKFEMRRLLVVRKELLRDLHALPLRDVRGYFRFRDRLDEIERMMNEAGVELR